jgi:hypothetical protein
MSIKKIPLVPYWTFHHENGWSKKMREPIESYSDITPFLEKYDYPLEPDCYFGHELAFIAVYENLSSDEFLLHFVLDNFVKIVFAENLPAFLETLTMLSDTLCGNLNVERMIEGE